MKVLLPIIVSLLLFNCKTETEKVSNNADEINTTESKTAQSIIDQSIDISGGEIIGESTIEFDFRTTHFKAYRDGGDFSLLRKMSKGKDYIVDSLSNDSFVRTINDQIVNLPDSLSVLYSASVNSVHYFSVLPYGLNGPAINKELLEDVSVKNKKYSTVKVTFNQDGGGEDFEDEFIYWINQETHEVDYLAYSYDEVDDMGIRFREAYNERYIEGVRFVDYNNFMPKEKAISLVDLPQLFENGQLELLSKIELDNITVSPN